MTGRRKADFQRVTGRGCLTHLQQTIRSCETSQGSTPRLRPPPEYQGSSRRAPVRQVGVCDPGVHASIAGVAIDCEWAEVGGGAQWPAVPSPARILLAPSPQGEAFPRGSKTPPSPAGDGFAARFEVALSRRERDGVRAFPALRTPFEVVGEASVPASSNTASKRLSKAVHRPGRGYGHGRNQHVLKVSLQSGLRGSRARMSDQRRLPECAASPEGPARRRLRPVGYRASGTAHSPPAASLATTSEPPSAAPSCSFAFRSSMP